MDTLIDAVNLLQDITEKSNTTLKKVSDHIRLETKSTYRVVYIIDDVKKLYKELAEVFYKITNRYKLANNITVLPKKGVKGEDILKYNYILDDSVIVIYQGGIFYLSTLIEGIYKGVTIYNHDHDILAYATLIESKAMLFLAYTKATARDNPAIKEQVLFLTSIGLIED